MRVRSILAAAGLAAATAAGALAPPATASAGNGWSVFIDLEVYAPDADTVLEGLTLELWDVSGTEPVAVTDPDCSPLNAIGEGLYAADFGVSCSAPLEGDYALGVSGLPAGATPTAFCSEVSVPNELIPGSDAQFTVGSGVLGVECSLTIVQPAVLIDKVVEDGPSADTPGDFTLEVYGDGGSQTATGTDSSTAFCGQGEPLTNCAVIPVPAGSYQIGESGPDGYVPSNVWCQTFAPEGIRDETEAFPTGIGEFTLGDDPTEQAFPFAECRITNRYYEGGLVVTKSVTNDDGGTLGPADFTAEVFTEPEGSLVTSAPCLADGTCLDVMLPIGDYRIGEADPQGYTPSVTCTVTGEPDGPGPITTNPPATSSTIPNFEAIPGDDAVATVEPFGEVTCEIVNDDPTTTTTLAPTTTDQGGGGAVPTTVAPILPPTGDSNGTMAIIATLLIAIGGALLVARRRIA